MRPKGYMKPELFLSAVKQIDESSRITQVEISGFGEPLLHPEFFTMINQCTFPLHIMSYLYTNGTLLNTPQKIAQILNAEFDCIFSLLMHTSQKLMKK